MFVVTLTCRFYAGAKRLGLRAEREYARAEFDAIDGNGGGHLLFDEFCAWMVQLNHHAFKCRMRGPEWAAANPNPQPFQAVDIAQKGIKKTRKLTSTPPPPAKPVAFEVETAASAGM